MPYGSKAELPAAVRSKLSEHQQTIWMSAFNAALKQYGSEEKAFAVAWAAANKNKGKEAIASGRARREWNRDGAMFRMFRPHS